MARSEKEMVVTRFQTSDDALTERFDDWHRFYKMYRSYLSDQNDAFSSLFIPHIFTNIEQILPRIVSTIMQAEPTVSVQPNSADDVESSKVLETLVNWQLLRTDFPSVITRIFKDTFIYGTCFGKIHWEIDETRREGLPNITRYRGPRMRHVSPFDLFPDPHASSMKDATYVIEHKYVELDRLKRWEQQSKVGTAAGGIAVDEITSSNFLNRQEHDERLRRLRNIGKISTDAVDETREWVEILEYWEEDRTIMVANREDVIRNEENPFVHGQIPYVVFRDYPISDEFYGIGEVENIEDLQHEVNTQRNQRIDARSLSIHPILQVSPGAMISNDEIVFEPGRIWRNEPGQIEPFALPDRGTPAVEEEQIAVQNMKETTSVTDIIRGQHTQNFPQTATGVSTLDVNAQTRFNMKVRNFERPITKAVEQMVQLNQQFLDEQEVIRVTGEISGLISPRMVEEKGPYKFLRFSDRDIQGFFDYTIKGAKSVSLLQRQQKFLQLLQVGTNFATEFNVREVLRRLFESMDVKDPQTLLNVPQEQIQRLAQTGALQGGSTESLQQRESENAGNVPRGEAATEQSAEQERESAVRGGVQPGNGFI